MRTCQTVVSKKRVVKSKAQSYSSNVPFANNKDKKRGNRQIATRHPISYGVVSVFFHLPLFGERTIGQALNVGEEFCGGAVVSTGGNSLKPIRFLGRLDVLIHENCVGKTLLHNINITMFQKKVEIFLFFLCIQKPPFKIPTLLIFPLVLISPGIMRVSLFITV